MSTLYKKHYTNQKVQLTKMNHNFSNENLDLGQPQLAQRLPENQGATECPI